MNINRLYLAAINIVAKVEFIGDKNPRAKVKKSGHSLIFPSLVKLC